MKTTWPTALGLFLVPLAATPLKAQSLRVGLQMGVSSSSFDLERSAGDGGELQALDEHRVGLTAGATVAYRLDTHFEVESGVLWIQKGAGGELQGFEEPIDTDVRLSYLQVPLLLRVTPFSGLPARVSLAAGPAVSLETHCEMEQDVSTLAAAIGCADDRSTTDVALVFGMGLSWRIGRADLMLEARYDLGLRDIDSIGALRTRTRGFTLAPRVSLPLG